MMNVRFVLRYSLACGLGSAALAGCSGGRDTSHTASNEAAHGIIAPTANVPALLGQSIDSLRRRLGPPLLLPKYYDPMLVRENRLTRDDSAASFRAGGLVVVASYNARTRQVRDLLLLGHHEDSLMGRATLRSNASEYLVLPVFVANSSQLIGLRVVPQ